MSDETKVAAEPADSSGQPDKRVDVEGTGGVADASNEQASKADAQVDVEGKGGTGVEGVEADEHQDVEKEVKTDDSGPTKAFDNSNEPDSAVTGESFKGGSADHEAAKGGTKPNGGPDVQPQRREDLEQESGFSNPQKGTDQWTGTGGNGVTKQAPAVTNVPTQSGGVTSHVVNIFKLADTEVELGMLDASQKYERIAELEGQDEIQVEAQLQTLARVRTAGLRKSPDASLTRLPSLKQASRDDASEQKTSNVDKVEAADVLFGL